MAGQRLAHEQRSGRPVRGSGPPQNPRSSVRLGHDLDLAGHLCGRDRPEPDPLRLSHDPHHRFLFWGAERRGTGKTVGPWPFIPGGAIGHQLHPRGGGGLDRRAHGGHAAKPARPDGSGRYSGLFCHQPLRLLGTAPARRPDQHGVQILCRLFRYLVYGADPGRGGGTLHRSVSSWVS